MSGFPADQNEMTGDDALCAYLDGLLTERVSKSGDGEWEGSRDVSEAEERCFLPEKPDDVPAREEEAFPDDGKGRDEDNLDEGALKVLIFKLGRLHFAVLTEQISKILTLDETQWFPEASEGDIIGCLSGDEGKIQVIDTARLILPGKNKGGDYHHLLVPATGGYGLACESVSDEKGVPWDEVRWREERGPRPWLLGMMKDDEVPCPLIDVILLLDELET